MLEFDRIDLDVHDLDLVASLAVATRLGTSQRFQLFSARFGFLFAFC